YFATLLAWQESEHVVFMGFLPIYAPCSQAGGKGALLCLRPERGHHLVLRGKLQHVSYCSEHHPEQDVQVIPGTKCPICMKPVEDRMSYGTMVCPACKRAWFHRDCIQVGAMPSALGISITGDTGQHQGLTGPGEQRDTIRDVPQMQLLHLQHQVLNQPVWSRRHQDRSRRTAARPDRPKCRETQSGMSRRINCAHQRCQVFHRRVYHMR
ncbi:hypothetical protein IHE44_0011307, partial [Lamprotornis superbus]